MLRRIFALTLVVLLITAMLSSCKKSPDDTDNKDSAKTQEEESNSDKGDPSDSSLTSTFEDIESNYTDGNIDDETYHTSKVINALAPTGGENLSDIVTRDSEYYDISRDAQWMVDHYEDLDESSQQMVRDFFLFDTTSDSSMIDLLTSSLVQNVMAEDGLALDDPLELYPKQIIENLYLHTSTSDFPLLPDLEEFITSVMLEDFPSVGEPIGYIESQYKVVVHAEDMLPNIDSFSCLSPDPATIGFPGPRVFSIHVNINKDHDTIRASLAHEIFHAYQYEMGYARRTNEENFFMESTAMWAVRRLDSGLLYPLEFTDQLYMNWDNMNIDTMDDRTMKSWYQLPYMFSYEYADDSLVKQYIDYGKSSVGIIDNLYTVALERETMQNYMSDFAQFINAEMGTEGVLFSSEQSPFADHALIATAHEDWSLNDFTHREEGKSMSVMDLHHQGYRSGLVSLEGLDNAIIDVQSALSKENYENRTGLVVFLHKNDDTWRLVMDGSYEDFMGHIDLKEEPSSELLFIFFNYHEDATIHKYAVNIQERIMGEGTIDIDVMESIAPGIDNAVNGTKSDDAIYNIHITENIELLDIESSSEMDGFNFEQLLYGDVYYIKNYQAILSGFRDIEYENGDTTAYSYNGIFDYRDGDAPAGSLDNPLFSLDLDALMGGGALGGDLGDLGEMPDLGDLGDLAGLGDLASSGLGDAMAGLQSELDEAKAELNASLGELGMDGLSMPGAGKLNRFKEILENETFHLYPQMPPGFSDTAWIDYELLRTYKDAEGKTKTDTDDGVTQLTFNPMPIWFKNPFYDPEEAMAMAATLPQDPHAFQEQFTGTDQVMDQIMVINGQMDESNLYHAFNQGQFTFDFKDFDKQKDGMQVQEILWDDFTETLRATITGDYVENGRHYNVTIKFVYKFK